MKNKIIVTLVSLLAFLSGGIAEEPFKNLLEGNTLDQWYFKKTDAGGWSINEEGVVHLKPKGGSLGTKEKFLDFEFTFEWKAGKGANSGIFYRQAKGKAPEYQILDDEHHVRGKIPKNAVGALYDIMERQDDSPVKPHGEWNTGRIVAKGRRLQHWLNGVKVVDIEVGSDDWKQRFAQSKHVKDSEKQNPDFGLQEGTIWLQDHGGEVWYRNMKIRKF